MKLWIYRWPNGEVTLVSGRDEEEALETLEEIGDTLPDVIERLPKDAPFYITFAPMAKEKDEITAESPSTATWTAAFDEFPDDLHEILGDAAEALKEFEKA
jgi:hypothetical protein